MKIATYLAAALLLAACAKTTSVQLAPNLHRISMKGNAFTDVGKAQDQTLLEAAEATLDAGHRYFVVVGSQDTTTVGSYVGPTTTDTNFLGTASTFGNATSLSGTATSTTYGGNVSTFTKPGMEVMIKTSETPLPNSFDAQEIATYLGPVYNPDRWGGTQSGE